MKRFLWPAVFAAVLLITLPVLASAAAQGPVLGAWETLTTSGTYTPRSNAASTFVASTNRIYIIGGVDDTGAVVGTMEAMRLTTFTWYSYADMPTPRRDAAAVDVDGKIYVIGGSDGTNPLATVEMYDPITNQWTTEASMPTARTGLVAVPYTTSGGVKQIHVYGGDVGPDAGFPADHAYQIYDVASDTWTQSDLLAPSVQIEACGVAATDMASGANYLYLFGGYSGGAAPSPGAWRIDPADQAGWDANVHTMPEGRILAGAATIQAANANGGSAQYPLIIGGSPDRTGTPTSSLMLYESGQLNGWISGTQVGPDLPEPRTGRPAVAFAANYVWVAGGSTTAGLASSVFRAPVNTTNYPPAPPVENSIISNWEDVGADISTPRQEVGAGVLTDADGQQKLYVAGGVAATQPDGAQTPIYDVVEAYNPQTNAWETKAPMPVAVMKPIYAVVDNKLYLFGGASDRPLVNGSYTDTIVRVLQIYDPLTDSWTLKDYRESADPLPTARERGEGYGYAGKFYALAGEDETHADSGVNEVYDPATDTWAVTQWPTGGNAGCAWPICEGANFVVENGDLAWFYMVGGGFAMTQQPLCAVANFGPANQGYAWAQIASLPVGGINGNVGLAVVDPSTGTQYPMSFGGSFGPAGRFDKVFTYYDVNDPVFPNKWLLDKPMPMRRSSRFAVGQIGSYVYIAGGEGPGPNGLIPNTVRGLVNPNPPLSASTVGEALAAMDGRKVVFAEDKPVSRTYLTMMTGETYFWVEEPDRSAALRVGPAISTVNAGDMVHLEGTISTDLTTGQRTLVPTSMVATTPATPVDIQAVGLTQRSFIGGTNGMQPGRPGGTGLNNMGLVAKVWGTVTLGTQYYTGYDMGCYFYIDDGSGLLDGTDTGGVPNVGLRVYVSPGSPAVAPGQRLAVRGIVGSEKVNGQMVPVLFADDFLSFYPADFRLF